MCGYRYARETGYFLGSMYFNYGATVMILVAGYFLLEALFALKVHEQAFVWIPFAFLFPLWFLRYARSLWMSVDLSISPPTEKDFVRRG